MTEQAAYVYVMASRQNGTLYTGSTPDLPRRAWEHPDLPSARHREKQIKEWRRKWKLELIESTNPQWADLYDSIAHG